MGVAHSGPQARRSWPRQPLASWRFKGLGVSGSRFFWFQGLGASNIGLRGLRSRVGRKCNAGGRQLRIPENLDFSGYSVKSSSKGKLLPKLVNNKAKARSILSL